MTTRQFDPVFSAALRNELEAIVDAGDAPARPRRPVRAALARPQVWVSLVTAIALAVVTVGVLRLSHESGPADPVKSIDPLAQITDPADVNYVARSVTVLAAFRGTGTGTREFDVAASVRSLRVYLTCAPSGHFSTSLDGSGESSGGCARGISSSFDMPVTPGTHTVSAEVAKRTRFSVLVIATPEPTIATGGLIDPLAAVRDLRNPDALTGDTAPLLLSRGDGQAADRAGSVAVGTRLRAYFVCRPASQEASTTIDGVVLSGCMNSIAHWVDFTATAETIDARTEGIGPWRLLVVRAPSGAKDTPRTRTLPYPEAGGAVLARARGFGAPATGTYRSTTPSIRITTTCRGTGWLEIQAGDSGTNTRGTACSTSTPSITGFGGDRKGKRQSWTVIPHGDISWTFQLSDDD